MACRLSRLTWVALCATVLQSYSCVSDVLTDKSSTEDEIQTVAETLRSLELNEFLRWMVEIELDHILNDSRELPDVSMAIATIAIC